MTPVLITCSRNRGGDGQPGRPPARGTEKGMEPVYLLCSRNARSRTPLVGRAQWEINQPPSLKRERASLEGSSVTSFDVHSWKSTRPLRLARFARFACLARLVSKKLWWLAPLFSYCLPLVGKTAQAGQCPDASKPCLSSCEKTPGTFSFFHRAQPYHQR